MIKISDEDSIGYNIQYSRDKVFAILFYPLLWAHDAKKCAKPEEIWYEVEEFVKQLKEVRYPEYQVPKLVEHMKACGMDDNNLFLVRFCVCYKLVASAKSGNEWAFRIFQLIYPDIQKHDWFEHFQLMADYFEKKLVKDGYKPVNLSKYDREHLVFDEKMLAEIWGEEEEDAKDVDYNSDSDRGDVKGDSDEQDTIACASTYQQVIFIDSLLRLVLGEKYKNLTEKSKYEFISWLIHKNMQNVKEALYYNSANPKKNINKIENDKKVIVEKAKDIIALLDNSKGSLFL